MSRLKLPVLEQVLLRYTKGNYYVIHPLLESEYENLTIIKNNIQKEFNTCMAKLKDNLPKDASEKDLRLFNYELNSMRTKLLSNQSIKIQMFSNRHNTTIEINLSLLDIYIYGKPNDITKKELFEILQPSSISSTSYWWIPSGYNPLDNTCDKAPINVSIFNNSKYSYQMSATTDRQRRFEYIVGRIGNPKYIIIAKHNQSIYENYNFILPRFKSKRIDLED